MEIATVPVHYVTLLLNAVEQQGIDLDELLKKIEIPAELLNEEKARIPRSSYVKLTGYLAKKLQDESFGLLKQPMKPGTFAMLCHACIGCDTLGHFLRRCTKFNDLTNDCVKLELTQDGQYAAYTVTPQPGMVHAEHHVVMLFLAIAHRLASWAIDQKIVLKEVNISRKRPDHADDYNLLFKAPINFGQKHNCFRFAAKYLDAQISQDEYSLRKFLKVSAIQLMSNLELDTSLSSKIRSMIKEDAGGQFPKFEEIAKSLNFTTATLRRRLRIEGITYQQIKDDVRRDTAIYHLSRKKMSVEEVAASAGFSEPTSFFRAFKRWTGTSPRAYTSAECA